MRKENKWSIIFILLLTCIFVSLAFNNNVWDDEIYSMRWTALSWGDMMRRLADDVHPPLYYILLKIVNGISGNNLIVAKLFSVLPMFVSLWVGITFIRQEFGKKSMVFYCVFLTFVPCVMEKAIEVRMYTWGILFCIMAGIFMYRLIQGTNLKNWVGFTIFSLLAAYNHYYGVAAMIVVYLSLFIFFIFTKQWKETLQFFVCAISTVIGYLPWLPIALKQITAVNDNYWITLPSSRLSIVRELFESNLPNSENILLPFVIILILYLIVLFFIKRKKEFYWALSMCAPLWSIFVFGQIYGMTVRPILISRYLLLSLGIMIMGLSVVWKYLNKYILILPCVFLLIVGCFQYKAVYAAEYDTLTDGTLMFLEDKVKEGDFIVWDTPSLNNSILYYFPIAVPKSKEYDIYLEEYDRIWMFSHFNDTIDFEKLTVNNIQYENMGAFGLDNVYFNIYLLTKDSIE